MKYVFHVDGLMCEKCVARLTNVLTTEDGIVSATVSLADKTATVETDAQADIVKTIIEDAGFDARLAQ
ncbi:MAG: heavy-metal-associated domain-containing protein [Ruminococcaceae bacterium]|nr:heavy-metal-associated domain-containing protein [Oscillospiraceae bacterium]